jgi:hypothetical protein
MVNYIIWEIWESSVSPPSFYVRVFESEVVRLLYEFIGG